MREINVNDWEEFEGQLKAIRQAEISANRTVNFLFRRLSDSAWPLTTTLERSGKKDMHISAYYRLISTVKPQIESFTGMKWKLRDFPEVDSAMKLNETVDLQQFPQGEEYSYMIHLRHHNFPSPLLDWTRSPYVASFFAFRSLTAPSSGKVSICLFSETPAGFKSSRSGDPGIQRLGPYVSTHRRHFLQQSDYTICAVFDNVWRLAEHETVFAQRGRDQDLLWKFNIPWTERAKVLRMLDTYNLNAFSLFDSEESLMETLAVRELDLRAAGLGEKK